MKTIYLENGINKVPADKNYFTRKFRTKFKVETPKNIDTSYAYKEVYYYDNFNTKWELDNFFIRVLKFYENGCVSSFSVEKGKPVNLFDFNPNNNGSRGVSYKKKGKQIVSIVSGVSEWGRYGVNKYEMEIKGDTIFVKKLGDNFVHVYSKEKLSKKNLLYKANW